MKINVRALWNSGQDRTGVSRASQSGFARRRGLFRIRRGWWPAGTGLALRSPCAAQSLRRSVLVVLEFADVMLGIKLDAELGDEVELRFKEVDVLFLVMHQLFEQVARDVIAHAVAMRGGFFVKRACRHFGDKVAVEHFLDRLADMQRIEHLHVGKAVEEDDTVDQLVGVFHFLDGFLAPLLGEILVAPVAEQPIMQPVLVDGRQFMPERLVEVIDDAGLALHFLTPALILVSEPRSAGTLIITIPMSAQRT